MPINKETIVSVFNKKLTLMEWLETIDKALENAVLTGVAVSKKGDATLSFKFTFEDGTYLETNDIVIQQGESVASANIENNHLYLTLTNGQVLDAGLLFNGDLNLNGDLNIQGDLSVLGSINGETSPSVKPIYYHGIAVESENYSDTLLIVIFNNTITPFSSLDDLKAWLSNVVTLSPYGVLVNIDGNATIEVEGVSYKMIMTGFYTDIVYWGEEKIDLIGVDLATGNKREILMTWQEFAQKFMRITDRCNKIN